MAELEERLHFDIFRSNACYRLRDLGDIEFINQILKNDEIRKLYQLKLYPESFYLLAMVDYISRMNNISLCKDYDDLRSLCLKETIYPKGILALDKIMNTNRHKTHSLQNAIPEFMQFNIVENGVKNTL